MQLATVDATPAALLSDPLPTSGQHNYNSYPTQRLQSIHLKFRGYLHQLEQTKRLSLRLKAHILDDVAVHAQSWVRYIYIGKYIKEDAL